MPIETLAPAPAQTTAAPAYKKCSGYILVVDDEEANRTLLRDPLEARGYEIGEASDGFKALELVHERRPDTILLDVMMPGMDGFQVCRRLKSEPGTRHIPVLMITALSERKERLMGIQAGANDFLNKPVDMQDLILRVGNAIYTKGLFDQLNAERDKSERLLLNTLPSAIAERMKNGETQIADLHPEVTVLVADLVGFTALASHIAPEQIVALLNEIFTAFDLLADKHQLEKIKTIGDAYMVAGGIPLPRPDHVEAVVRLGLEMSQAIKHFNHQYETSMQIRIGINTGPVVAGVIGRKKFAYDLWGDTVNVACRLESSGWPGSIQVSESTYERLRNGFEFDGCNSVEVKGCGQINAYSLAGPID